MKEIKISEELRNYVEMLDFESRRYKDFLATVRRDSCPMTDEEWNSSLEYFQTLCAEAQVKFDLVKQEISEMYKDEINGESWLIQYKNCAMYIGVTDETEIPKRKDYRQEVYNDMLRRFYPPKEVKELRIGDDSVKTLTLQVTDACNLACTYCYQHHKGKHSMSFETAKKFVDLLLNADDRINHYVDANKSIGVIIDFIGGEPWLEVDLISKISDYFIGELFRRKHPWASTFMFDVCSNGLLHFDPRVQEYMKRHKGHLSYNISIDGNKKLHDSCRVDFNGHGSYDKAIAGVRDFRDNFGGNMGSKMTIAPENVIYVTEAVKSLVKNNYTEINLNCVYEEGWTKEHANTLYWQLHDLIDWLKDNDYLEKITFSMFTQLCGKPLDESDDKNWCGGTGLMLAVDYKGDLFPCLRYMESSIGNREPYIIGNLDEGICKNDITKKRVKCFECITRRSQSTDECFNCPIGMGCGWCSAYNYECFGTVDKRATYICCMHKARVLANVYYWRLRGVDYPMNCPEEWAVEIIGREEYEKLKNMEVMNSGDNNISREI